MYKNVTHWKTFFRKLTLSSHGHVALLLPYTTQLFLSTASPRWGGNCSQRKFYPYFFGNVWKFPKLFHHRIRFDWGHKWPRLESAEIRRLGWGQKQIFEKGEKLFFVIAKKSGNLVFLQTCFCNSVILSIYFWKFREYWETSLSLRGLNPSWVVLFCRVTVKTHWL